MSSWETEFTLDERILKRSVVKHRLSDLEVLGSGTFARVLAISREVVVKVYDESSLFSASGDGEDESFVPGVVNSYPFLKEIASMFILDRACAAAHRPPVCPVLYRFRSKGEVAHLFMQRACCLDDRKTYRALLKIAEEESLQKVVHELEKTSWETLAFVHEMGVMHRDIKPANMVLAGRQKFKVEEEDEEEEDDDEEEDVFELERPLRMMLIDWNSSRFSSPLLSNSERRGGEEEEEEEEYRRKRKSAKCTQMTNEVYTAYTRPPEICRSVSRKLKCIYDDRADVWAMGMALLNILSKFDDHLRAEASDKLLRKYSKVEAVAAPEVAEYGGEPPPKRSRHASGKGERHRRKKRRVFETVFIDPLKKCATFEEECEFMCSAFSSEFGRFYPSRNLATNWFESRLERIPREYVSVLSGIDEALKIDPCERSRAIDILGRTRRRGVVEAAAAAKTYLTGEYRTLVETGIASAQGTSRPEGDGEEGAGEEENAERSLSSEGLRKLAAKVLKKEPGLEKACSLTLVILDALREGFEEKTHALFWGILMMCATLMTNIIPTKEYVARKFAKLKVEDADFVGFVKKVRVLLEHAQRNPEFFRLFILGSYLLSDRFETGPLDS